MRTPWPVGALTDRRQVQSFSFMMGSWALIGMFQRLLELLQPRLLVVSSPNSGRRVFASRSSQEGFPRSIDTDIPITGSGFPIRYVQCRVL